MNKDERERLEAMRDELNEMLENNEDEGGRVQPKRSVFRMRFSEVQKMLDAGLIDTFQVGDEIWNENRLAEEPICWIVIGKTEDAVTLWAVQGLAERPFATKSEKYPYGHALWRDCSLRGWLNGELLDGFQPEDAAAIATVKKATIAPMKDGDELIETEDKLWLLSATEAGFAPDEDWSPDEGEPFPYFGNDEARQIGDWWFLRSASRGYVHYAWYVTTSGGASYGYTATNAYRPAPACVIRKS